MEIIKITLERMSQVLPQTVKDSDLSKNAKKVLATIINYHLVNDKVRTTGFLAINNENLRQSAGIGKEYLRAAVQELIECRLIERKAGSKWKEGEPRTASEYRLVKENLTKPIHKPTSNDLLEMLFSTPSEPLCTGDSPTNTNTVTDTGPNTETDTYSETISDTISESYSDSISQLDISEDKQGPKNQKELKEYFKNRMEILCKDKNIDELNEIQEVLETELDEFNEINGYQDVFKYFVIPAIEKKKERLSSQYLIDIMTKA